MYKDIIHFAKRSIKGKKLYSKCKKCKNLIYRKWYLKNYKKRNMQTKLYLKNNPWMKTYLYINQRCNNSNNTAYNWYGGRGIQNLITSSELKQLWFRDKAYKMKQPSIDRINSDGHYEYKNCRYIELIENLKRVAVGKGIKPILQYHLNGNLIKKWPSIKSAACALKIDQKQISHNLRNRQKTCHGFIWRYENKT